MPRKKAIFALLALSLLTHLPGISSPLFDFHGWAQTLRASLARNYYESDMNLFRPKYDYIETGHSKAPQFPLYSYLVALLYKMFGFHEFLGRLLSAIFAALSAAFLFLLVCEFFDDKTAFLSASVYCFLPIRIYFMRAFMPEAMTIFCLVAGYYFFLRWESENRFFPHGLFAAALLTLVPLLKVAYLWLVLVPFLYAGCKSGYKSLLSGKYLLAGLAVILSCLGWYGYVNRGAEQSEGFIRQIIGVMSLLRAWSGWKFWTVHFLSRFPELLTTYGGLVFFFAGAWQIGKERKTFFMVWFFVTVFYILMCGEYGMVHQYVSLPFAPVNAVFIGAGMAYFLRERRGKTAFSVLGILLAVSIPVHGALRVRKWYRLSDTWMVHAKEVADRLSSPDDLFYVNSPNEPFYLYHLHRKGWASHLEGEGLEVFKQALSQGARFLFVPCRDTEMDWDALRPTIASAYACVYADGNFEIYDLKRKPE